MNRRKAMLRTPTFMNAVGFVCVLFTVVVVGSTARQLDDEACTIR